MTGSTSSYRSSSSPGGGADSYGGETYLVRSVDGGRSWAPARKIFDAGVDRLTTGHQLVALPNGVLVDVFTLVDFRDHPRDPDKHIAIARSTDHGRTWSEPTSVARFDSIGTTDPRSGDAVAGSSRLLSDVAVDRETGRLYVVWQDARWSNGEANAIALSSSPDGGRSWTAPTQVNATPRAVPTARQQAFTPSIAVGEDGTVAVGYYDFRNDTPGRPLWTDRWLVRCSRARSAGCTTSADFRAEVRLTDSRFDMGRATRVAATRSLDLSGYVGLVAAGPDFLAVFPVTRPTNPGVVVARRVPAE